jgi:hypothetical protein
MVYETVPVAVLEEVITSLMFVPVPGLEPVTLDWVLVHDMVELGTLLTKPIETASPLQIEGAESVVLKMGTGFTKIVPVALAPEHPAELE